MSADLPCVMLENPSIIGKAAGFPPRNAAILHFLVCNQLRIRPVEHGYATTPIRQFIFFKTP
jgi:hypothetical protein